jgi:hypothetical protein
LLEDFPEEELKARAKSRVLKLHKVSALFRNWRSRVLDCFKDGQFVHDGKPVPGASARV